MRCLAWALAVAAAAGSAVAASPPVVCNVVDYGALGDAKTYDTDAFVKAIKACEGRGTVLVPPSPYQPSPKAYLLTPINVTSNTHLHIMEGATIIASTNFSLWPVVAPLPSYEWELRYHGFISGWGVENVTIDGKGVIDGQGAPWWEARHELNGEHLVRPRLIEPLYCNNFTIKGVWLRDSPFWTVHPYSCSNVTVESVRISSPLWAASTDGIDPDSCDNVLIKDCDITSSDDHVAIKSGKDESGRAYGKPSTNIRVEGGRFGHGYGVSIGSEMSGGVYNVTVDGVRFEDTLYVARVKTCRGRGGEVSNITFRNLDVSRVQSKAIFFDMYYKQSPPVQPVRQTTPHVHDWTLSNITGTAAAAGAFACLPESPCHDIVLENVQLRAVGGFRCLHAYGTAVDVSPESCLADQETMGGRRQWA